MGGKNDEGKKNVRVQGGRWNEDERLGESRVRGKE